MAKTASKKRKPKGAKKRTGRVPATAQPNIEVADLPVRLERLTGTKRTEQLKRFVRAASRSFLAPTNITSIGIGHKVQNGRNTGKLSIQFTVATKAPLDAIGATGSKAIPPFIEIDGIAVPTDVLERTYRPSYTAARVGAKDERKRRMTVMRPGASISSTVTTDAGTLGTFARDKRTNEIVMLSNWHVLDAGLNPLDGDIVQPGRYDDYSTAQNLAGRLLRSHIGAAGDCAIASTGARAYSNIILGLDTSVMRIGTPQQGDRVVKSGRTTGLTYGIVGRPVLSISMPYSTGTQVVGGFEIGPDDQNPSEFGMISDIGDSGSAWMFVDKNGQPNGTMLGLHFGLSDNAATPAFAVACFARSVMTKLEIEPI
ncbi:MAG: hypothetical protein C0421_07895 [Hyphomonas sp.]|uniref:hypothetical protein n=1 Tax=Hyphomonas sp. TaxID=87 RepID=UPI0025C5F656|nr:hypothetical protein [Hyphomonas sp.]MBA4338752.1 hypothetical protein [Hyphomonas sp.]